MFLDMIRNFYSKVFIGIDLDLDSCQINIIRVKNNKIKQNIKTQTKLINNALSMEALKLIDFYQRKYPFTYIGMISKTPNQGAIPTANPQEFLQHNISLKQVDFVCLEEAWSAYIKRDDCYVLTRQIPELGHLDCLFSPFVPIFHFAQKKEKLALYTIQEKQTLSVAIADSEKIHYGKTFIFEEEVPEFDSNGGQESLSSLDRLLKTLTQDMDHLDSLDLPQETKQEEDKQKLDDLNDFMRATFVTGAIESVISDYYQHNQSSFIDEIVIFDTYGITPDSLKYINDSLMIETQVYPMSLAHEITTLMLKEYQKGIL